MRNNTKPRVPSARNLARRAWPTQAILATSSDGKTVTLMSKGETLRRIAAEAVVNYVFPGSQLGAWQEGKIRVSTIRPASRPLKNIPN